MKKKIGSFVVCCMLGVLGLCAPSLAATTEDVQNAISGGQQYLLATQIQPVFGTGSVTIHITASDFPEAEELNVGDEVLKYVDLAQANVLKLISPTIHDDSGDDSFECVGECSGVQGDWKFMDGNETITLTFAGDGNFTITATQDATTYTATGTYVYDPAKRYLKQGGYWEDDLQDDPLATTAFAVAALLETGFDRNNEAIEAGILFILRYVLDDPDEDWFGAIYDPNQQWHSNYSNAACLIALSLYDETSDAMLAIVKNAADFSLSRQNLPVPEDSLETPEEFYGAYYGGWTYRKTSSGEMSEGDLSNAQFGAMGLWYAYRYLGKSVENEGWAKALLKYVERCHGWYNRALLVINSTESSFPEESGLAVGTRHLTIANVNGNSLTIKDEKGDEKVYVREGDGDSVVGKWRAVDDNTFVLDFNAAGIVTVTGTNAGRTENYTAKGTYEIKEQTWNDQDWVKTDHDTWGVDGAFSYKPTYEDFYGAGPMLGAGLWCLSIIGEDLNPMVEIALAYFNNEKNYTWDTPLGGGNAYFYATYSMAKALTVTMGTTQKLGDHEWVQDLKDMMVDVGNGHINHVVDSDPVQNYWRGTEGLDGGNVLATSWVLMSLAFADPNVESPHKILADEPSLENLVSGNVKLSVFNGVTISGAARVAIANAQKEQSITMPVGAFDFTLNNVPQGGSVELKIEVPAETMDPANPNSFVNADGTLKQGVSWFKIVNGNWKGQGSVPIQIDPASNSIRVTLKDGGPEDADGLADGKIEDPAAPGFGVSSSSDDDDNSCFIRAIFFQ